MKKIKIYKAKDRQGIKYFSNKPTYASGFDFFKGDKIEPPRNRKDYILITKFRVKVTGLMVDEGIYPKEMKVGY